MSNKSVSVRVNVTPEVHEVLTKQAEQADVSVAHIIRKLIREHLNGTHKGETK